MKLAKSILVLIILFTIQSIAVNAQDIKNVFVGKWNATVLDLPQGNMSGLLKIELKNENLSGSFTDKLIKKELVFSSVVMQDSVLTANFDYQGMQISMKLTRKSDEVKKIIYHFEGFDSTFCFYFFR